MKKLEQIVLLVTCLAIMVVCAIQRDGQVWGHELAEASQADTTSHAAINPITVLDDGTTIINTTSLGKDIIGYAGPVPLEIHLKEGTISEVIALDNNETPEFFEEAEQILTRWNGKEVEEAQAVKVDAVSGATFTSRAIIQNVQVGLQYASQNATTPSIFDKLDLSLKNIAGLIVVLMAAIIPLFFRNKTYRTVQLTLNVIVLGLWCGTFLNWSMFVGYMSNGINVWISLIPMVMLITAFVYPLFGKKSYYCTNVCPFGSIQDLAGKTNHKKWKMGVKTVKRLRYFRQALFAVLMILMLTGVGFEWMDYEVFSAFIFQSAAVTVMIMAVVFVLLAIFIPRPYCRFVCPTGTLVKLSEGNK
ncbi:MAG: FMN-binding protein [Prevotella sp.]|jgi:NosR/NirI family nitrous oxide reductase transcriptional regulator